MGSKLKRRVGRNDSCPCGSGKKYKYCCMEKDTQKKPQSSAIAGVLYGPMESGKDHDFYNRFLFQNLEIRSFVVSKNKRLDFDHDYKAFVQNLIEAKMAKTFMLRVLNRHREEIMTGEDGIITGHQLNINNPIDDELNLFFKDFFIRGTMATKGLQRLLDKWFGYNIGFMFSDNEKKFTKGAAKFKLSKDDSRFQILNNFIKSHRDGWYQSFSGLRNKIEHEGFSLPKIKHRVDANGKVLILVPRFGEQTLEEVLEISWKNLSTLCEEVYIFIASLELKNGYVIWRIPKEKRKDHNWARYKIALPEFPEAHVSTS